MLKRIFSFITFAFVAACMLGACVLAQFTVRADQVGELTVESEYPGAFTAFFGDEPDVYIKNVGDTYSHFAYKGREVSLAPGERLHLEQVKPGDEVTIDLVMPILFGAHITGVTTKAPVRIEPTIEVDDEPASGDSSGQLDTTAAALAVAE